MFDACVRFLWTAPGAVTEWPDRQASRDFSYAGIEKQWQSALIALTQAVGHASMTAFRGRRP